MEKNKAFLIEMPWKNIVDVVIAESLLVAEDFEEDHEANLRKGKNNGIILGSVKFESEKNMNDLAKDFSKIYGGSILEHEYECDVRFPSEKKEFLISVFKDYFTKVK